MTDREVNIRGSECDRQAHPIPYPEEDSPGPCALPVALYTDKCKTVATGAIASLWKWDLQVQPCKAGLGSVNLVHTSTEQAGIRP